MNPRYSNRLLCPCCGAALTRVSAGETRPRSVMARIGDALISEILFWPITLVIAVVFLWSFLAGAVLIALGIVACAFGTSGNPVALHTDAKRASQFYLSRCHCAT